jgi:hypothetical protein
LRTILLGRAVAALPLLGGPHLARSAGVRARADRARHGVRLRRRWVVRCRSRPTRRRPATNSSDAPRSRGCRGAEQTSERAHRPVPRDTRRRGAASPAPRYEGVWGDLRQRSQTRALVLAMPRGVSRRAQPGLGRQGEQPDWFGDVFDDVLVARIHRARGVEGRDRRQHLRRICLKIDLDRARHVVDGDVERPGSRRRSADIARSRTARARCSPRSEMHTQSYPRPG